MLKLKKILVPVDFSEEAGLALEWAIKLAKEEKESTLYLLHVILPMPLLEGGFEVAQVIDEQRKAAEKKLEAWRRRIPAFLTSRIAVEEGDIVVGITGLCERENIDLVVMTTRGRHGLSRLAHPNLSERVVRNAPAPVLVLHLNQKAEEAAKAMA